MVIVEIFGGLAVFLYGLHLAREGLTLYGGDRLRRAVHSLTDSPFRGLLVGIIITTFLQSSSASIVMLVGFASSGMVTLLQGIGVILGADIGATITVQLIAFRVMDYALLPVGLGFFFGFFVRRRSLKYLGRTVMGFGLVFYGIKVMADGAEPLVHSQIFLDILRSLSDNPIGGLAFAALFTAIIQSSSATIGLIMSFGISGAITLHAAIPLVLGANIGTCITAFLATPEASAEGKQIAWTHIMVKILGVGIIWPFVAGFEQLIGNTAEGLPRQIANAHTIFNLGVGAFFLPLRKMLAGLMIKIVPGGEDPRRRYSARYLDPRALSAPDLAFGNATREILRVSDIVEGMLKDSLVAFIHNDLEEVEEIRNRDEEVDTLERQVKLYLTRMSQEELTAAQAEREMMLHSFVSSLETIGDVVVKNILALAEKKIQQGRYFSQEGWEEIQRYHQQVTDNLGAAIAAFTSGERDLVEQVRARVEELDQEERRLKQKHIQRLRQGLKESIDTSAIHLDLLNNLQRINSEIESGLIAFHEEQPQES